MAPKSLEGQMLGKYRILEPLGSGGMARVYRAYHPQLDRYVAVKVLRSDLMEEHEFLARFRREAQSVANLRHPNIIQVFDFDTEADTSYMVMELLEGDTLKARLNAYRARGETMPVGEMIRITLDALDGLGFAHSAGMIHRDIKPANILLSGRGQAVLTDFGIAQIVGGTQYTTSGALMGTLNYMAPEQGMQKGDARSDIYSMGIVLYELFTGQPPFDADTPLAILLKHLNDPLPLPRTLNPDIPESFERVILKALSKPPEDRYQTAAEMAQALREAAAQASIQLPEHISLPPVVRAAEAPTGPVAVYSGTSRLNLADASFAADDTDTTLNAKLATEQAKHATARTKTAPEREPELPPAERSAIVRAALGGIGLLVGYNLVSFALSGVFNNFHLFTVGWPLEILFVGLFFCLLMDAMALIWLLIPAGTVLIIGLMLAFYRFSHLWERWQLWALLPLFLGGLIAYTVVQGTRHSDQARPLARHLAQRLMLTTTLFIAITGGLITFGIVR
jgi:serine/threonine protein kinase